MKRTNLIPVILLLFAGGGCLRPSLESPGTLKGKLVAVGPCGQYVIQVLTGDLDSSRIQKSWTDSGFNGGKTTYTNVFTVRNVCDFANYHLSKNDAISFIMKDTVITQGCAVCLIYYPVPAISNTVSQIHVYNGM